MNNPRIKAISFTPQAILAVFAHGAIIEMPNGERYQCAVDIPTDARFHHAFYEPCAGRFAIVMEHESFLPVTENMDLEFTACEIEPMTDAEWKVT